MQANQQITLAASCQLPTKDGEFRINVYQSLANQPNHLAILKGTVAQQDNVLVRIHSECITGDVFGSRRCDCGEQLEYALRAIEQNGCGVVLYLRQEGRGIGLVNKIKAYVLQEQGLDTIEANEKLGFPADLRDYEVGAQILRQLQINSIDLMTNNPDKLNKMQQFGIKVHQRVPIEIAAQPNNKNYLITKKLRMGHWLTKE